MFSPFRHEVTIGRELQLPVARPALHSKTAFTAGTLIRSIRRPVIPCLPPAALWLLIGKSSLSWEVLTGCLRRHTVRMWSSVFARADEDGVAFMSHAASSCIGIGAGAHVIQSTA